MVPFWRGLLPIRRVANSGKEGKEKRTQGSLVQRCSYFPTKKGPLSSSVLIRLKNREHKRVSGTFIFVRDGVYNSVVDHNSTWHASVLSWTLQSDYFKTLWARRLEHLRCHSTSRATPFRATPVPRNSRPATTTPTQQLLLRTMKAVQPRKRAGKDQFFSNLY